MQRKKKQPSKGISPSSNYIHKLCVLCRSPYDGSIRRSLGPAPSSWSSFLLLLLRRSTITTSGAALRHGRAAAAACKTFNSFMINRRFAGSWCLACDLLDLTGQETPLSSPSLAALTEPDKGSWECR